MLTLPDTSDELAPLYAVTEARHLRATMVMGLDGSIRAGATSEGLTGPDDRRLLGALRDLCDAVLVGAKTAVAEGYQRPVSGPDRRQRRRRHGSAGTAPRLVVVSGRLSLDPAGPVLGERAGGVLPLVITGPEAPKAKLSAARKTAEVWVLGKDVADLPAAIERLADEGCPRVLCEGGPTLLRAIAGAGLLDELALTLSPRLGGGLVAADGLPELVGLHPSSVRQASGFTFLRFTREPRPGPAGD